MLGLCVVLDDLQHSRVAIQAAYDGMEWFFVFIKHELVHQKTFTQRAGDAVIHTPCILPGLHGFAMLFPEICWQLLHAAVEQVGVF